MQSIKQLNVIIKPMDNRLEKIKAWLGSGSINLFGLPFSGKDTQGRQLATDLTGSLISSGDVLRHSQDNPEIQAIMKAGGIIPSQVFESIILPYLKRPEFAGKPIILSEVGRLLEEVPIITKASADSGHPLKAVIFLTLTDEAGLIVAVAVLDHFAQGRESLLIEQDCGLLDLLAGNKLLVFAHPRNDARVTEQDTDSRGGHVDGGGDGVIGEAVRFEQGDAIMARRELFDGYARLVHRASMPKLCAGVIPHLPSRASGSMGPSAICLYSLPIGLPYHFSRACNALLYAFRQSSKYPAKMKSGVFDWFS